MRLPRQTQQAAAEEEQGDVNDASDQPLSRGGQRRYRLGDMTCNIDYFKKRETQRDGPCCHS